MQLLPAILALALLASPAWAAAIDFDAAVTDLDGRPIPDCVGNDCANKPPILLRDIAVRALVASYPDEEKSISGEEKFKRGELALRVHKGGKVDLSAEDIALLKKLIGKGFSPLVVTRTWPMLDPQGK